MILSGEKEYVEILERLGYDVESASELDNKSFIKIKYCGAFVGCLSKKKLFMDGNVTSRISFWVSHDGMLLEGYRDNNEMSYHFKVIPVGSKNKYVYDVVEGDIKFKTISRFKGDENNDYTLGICKEDVGIKVNGSHSWKNHETLESQDMNFSIAFDKSNMVMEAEHFYSRRQDSIKKNICSNSEQVVNVFKKAMPGLFGILIDKSLSSEEKKSVFKSIEKESKKDIKK